MGNTFASNLSFISIIKIISRAMYMSHMNLNTQTHFRHKSVMLLFEIK